MERYRDRVNWAEELRRFVENRLRELEAEENIERVVRELEDADLNTEQAHNQKGGHRSCRAMCAQGVCRYLPCGIPPKSSGDTRQACDCWFIPSILSALPDSICSFSMAFSPGRPSTISICLLADSCSGVSPMIWSLPNTSLSAPRCLT